MGVLHHLLHLHRPRRAVDMCAHGGVAQALPLVDHILRGSAFDDGKNDSWIKENQRKSRNEIHKDLAARPSKPT